MTVVYGIGCVAAFLCLYFIITILHLISSYNKLLLKGVEKFNAWVSCVMVFMLSIPLAGIFMCLFGKLYVMITNM